MKAMLTMTTTIYNKTGSLIVHKQKYIFFISLKISTDIETLLPAKDCDINWTQNLNNFSNLEDL